MKARWVCARFIARLLVLLAWVGIAEAGPMLGAFADVSAKWGILSTGPLSASDPSVASRDAVVDLDPNNDVGAVARAKASVFPDATGRLLHSSSLVDEAGPASLATMEATSTARVVTQWIVTSDGSEVLAGSPVDIDTILSFEGSLFAINGEPFAEVMATMNVYRGDAMTTVFQGAGRMQSGVFGPSSNVLTTSGDFSGRFSHPCPGGTSLRSACLDFDENFPELFSVIVGELFEVELILRTHAEGVIADGEGRANADFYNSGGFLLSTDEDVEGLRLSQIVDAPAAVPEPATLALLGLGLAGLGLSRRKRA